MYNEALAIAEKRNHPCSMGFVRAALGLINCYEGNYRRGKEAIEIGIENVRKNNAHHATLLLVYRSHALWLEKACWARLSHIATQSKNCEAIFTLFVSLNVWRGWERSP
jgi:hypothetical protein